MGSNSVGNVLKILSFDAVFYDSASTCTTVTLSSLMSTLFTEIKSPIKSKISIFFLFYFEAKTN